MRTFVYDRYAGRDLRQRQIVPPAKLAACCGLVVGVGAIGRQVAIQLAAIGVPRLDLVDFDRVGVENLAPQAYFQQDVGRSKVAATAEAIKMINPAVAVTSHAERFRRSSPKALGCFADASKPTAVFCCVDSVATRQLVWQAVKSRCAFFADGRMSAEVIRVLASDKPARDSYYPTTLFAPEQAYGGSCTARSTVYTAAIAAGLMLSGFTRWLRGLPLDSDVSLNLLSGELSSR
jgi:molybdopterin-synthase adenylyltransferase